MCPSNGMHRWAISDYPPDGYHVMCLAQPRQLLQKVWEKFCLLEEWADARDTITIWRASGRAPLIHEPKNNGVITAATVHSRSYLAAHMQLEQMDRPRTTLGDDDDRFMLTWGPWQWLMWHHRHLTRLAGVQNDSNVVKYIFGITAVNYKCST